MRVNVTEGEGPCRPVGLSSDPGFAGCLWAAVALLDSVTSGDGGRVWLMARGTRSTQELYMEQVLSRADCSWDILPLLVREDCRKMTLLGAVPFPWLVNRSL